MSNKITNKKSKIFKIKIFYFTLGILVCSLVGVSAATYFESNAVTYDNTESGLNSTDVQGAIDELYNACKTPVTGGNGILEKVDIVTSGDGLYEDEYEEGRFIFKGGNPNNYVTFNNETAGWRIISIESDKTIKIMKIASIGNKHWDTGSTNNWKRPATLNTYLNEDYLVNFFNTTAKNQIVASNFSIGGVTENNNMSTQVIDENSNKWYGKVALPTLSEYIRTNSNKSRCGTYMLFNDNYNSCASTGWMDNNNNWWTLTPESGSPRSVFRVHSDYNYIHHDTVDGAYGHYAPENEVHPVVFLSSEVQITGGNGSQNDPYTIK